MILEYAAGGELFELIARRQKLDEDESRLIFQQLISAIEGLHADKYAHRDLKPENILTDGEGNAVIADWGASRELEENNEFVAEHTISFNSTIAGTDLFMAPEVKKEEPNGLKADVFSFS